MKQVLITGANGFVGRHLCAHLAQAGWAVRAIVRSADTAPEVGAYGTVHDVGDISADTRWDPLLADVNAVVHLAARVHVMFSSTPQAQEAYRRDNTAATIALARAAARCGVRDFVFSSSVKVHGERTPGRPFCETDTPRPLDAYAISKWEAELQLREIAKSNSLAVTILRLPLVYGAGVKGNFMRLLKLVDRGMPMPFASVQNVRSLLYVGNLVDAIEKRLAACNSGAETFLISDGHDFSTPQLIASLAAALKVKPRLFACPVSLLRAMGGLAGKGGEISRMVESLAIDPTKFQRQLHWLPPFSAQEGLDATARWFRTRGK